MTQPVRVHTETPRARPYRGGCQCGAVHYEVTLDLNQPGGDSGSVWQYRVSPTRFTLLIGDESLSGYQFSTEAVHHFFCIRCGVHVFSQHIHEGSDDVYTVDVRTLHSRKLPSLNWQYVAKPIWS